MRISGLGSGTASMLSHPLRAAVVRIVQAIRWAEKPQDKGAGEPSGASRRVTVRKPAADAAPLAKLGDIPVILAKVRVTSRPERGLFPRPIGAVVPAVAKPNCRAGRQMGKGVNFLKIGDSARIGRPYNGLARQFKVRPADRCAVHPSEQLMQCLDGLANPVAWTTATGRQLRNHSFIPPAAGRPGGASLPRRGGCTHAA